MSRTSNCQCAYTGIIGLKKSHLDALFLEQALGLGQIERRMVRRGVPGGVSILLCRTSNLSYARQPYQLVRKVILSVDMLVFETVTIRYSSVRVSPADKG